MLLQRLAISFTCIKPDFTTSPNIIVKCTLHGGLKIFTSLIVLCDTLGMFFV